MQTTQVITLLATILASGWVAAALTQLFKRTQWPSYAKLILAMVVAALVGLAASWLTGDATRFVALWKAGAVTSDQAVAYAVLVFTSAQVWYHKFLADQGWAKTLANVGSKTT